MKKVKDILGQEIIVGDRVAMAQSSGRGGARWQTVGQVTEIAHFTKSGKTRKQVKVTIKIHRHGGGGYMNKNTTLDASKCLIKITHCDKCGKLWNDSFDFGRGHECKK
jgi:hypothetical protein